MMGLKNHQCYGKPGKMHALISSLCTITHWVTLRWAMVKLREESARLPDELTLAMWATNVGKLASYTCTSYTCTQYCLEAHGITYTHHMLGRIYPLQCTYNLFQETLSNTPATVTTGFESTKNRTAVKDNTCSYLCMRGKELLETPKNANPCWTYTRIPESSG